MKVKKLLATVAISTILLTGCTFGPNGNTIIKVNDKNITLGSFNEKMDQETKNPMFSQMGVDLKNDKNNFLYLMLKDKIVNELIIKSLIDQEIEKRNIQVTKEDVEKEIQALIDKSGSKENFDNLLKQNGISSAQLKKDVKEEVKIKKLVNALSKINVSDADAKKFYKENVAKFKNPEKVRASHILISANPEEIKSKLMSDPTNKDLSKDEIKTKVDAEMAKQLEKAKKILTEVKKHPAAFAVVAKETSDDKTSAAQGGDLGFFGKNEMVEPFAKAAFAQKPNTISDIVQTPYGYHIILVKDRKAAGLEPFEKVKPEIKTYLENQEQVKVLENLIESLKKQAKIEYVDKEYNPANIQKEMKDLQKNLPGLPPAGKETPAQAKNADKK